LLSDCGSGFLIFIDHAGTMALPLTFRVASSTHRGCVRPANQDAIAARDGLWVVADGVGGLSKGEVASKTIIDALCGLDLTACDLRLAVYRRIIEANGAILARAEPKGMAATVAVLGIDNHRFFCLWAGDCRIYLRRDGTLKQLTRDHRVVQELVDAGAIDDAAARSHPRRNVVTRAVGIEQDLALDEREGAVRVGDVFVLASDGVTSVCSDSELDGFCGLGDPDHAVNAIVDLCVSRGAPDNLSIIVVNVGACPM
jgi:serine/threonine protein phosphatase Stp1